MTTTKIYINRQNPHKFIEIHNDGHYHNSVRQFMFWSMNGVKNRTGDGFLHRWRIGNLRELLSDYSECNSDQIRIIEIHDRCRKQR